MENFEASDHLDHERAAQAFSLLAPRSDRVAERVHPALPEPMSGGQVAASPRRRPPPPPRRAHHRPLSMPSGMPTSSPPPAYPSRAPVTPGSVARLHPLWDSRNFALEDEAPDDVEAQDIDVTFTNLEEADEPTERLERRSELPPSVGGSKLTPHLLPAIPVAIRPHARGGVILVPIAEDDEPADGAPTAILVPDSSRDAAMIVRLLEGELGR
jgi:hypothetical protein